MKIIANAFGVWTIKHLRLLWVLMLLPILWWAVDRTPPFKVVEYTIPPPVKSGSMLHLDMAVRRDVHRECSVTWNRYLIDSHGIRHDYGGPSRMSAEGVEAMDIAMNGRLKIDLLLPLELPIGRANIVTVLDYKCNPLHAIWPIEVTTHWVIDII